MYIELYTFSKNLKPEAIQKALELKKKLEDNNAPPKHFRVATRHVWQKGFKQQNYLNYNFVKEKFDDLAIAEKNFNRNVDSPE